MKRMKNRFVAAALLAVCLSGCSAMGQTGQSIPEKYGASGLAAEYLSRCDLLLQQERYDEAAANLVKAFEYDTEAGLLYAATYPENWLEEVMAELDGMAEKEPWRPLWPYIAGKVSQTHEQYTRAAIYFTKVAEMVPEDFFDAIIADCYYSDNRYHEASEYYKRAGDKYPGVISYVGKLADSREGLGDFDAALAYRDRMVAEHPDDKSYYAARARTLMKAGKYDKAMDDLSKVASFGLDKMEEAANSLTYADALRLSGQRDKARAMYGKVVETALKSGAPDASLALAYASLGEGDKAVAAMERVLAADSVNEGADCYRQACMFVRLGRNADAIAALEKAHSAGFYNGGQIMTDYDMAPIRDTEEFRNLMIPYYPQLFFDPVDDTQHRVISEDEPTEDHCIGTFSSKISE